MGKFYLFHLAYNGSTRKGWQKQPGQLTIEKDLEDVIRAEWPKGKVQMRAASRTDAGVHALCQVVKVLLPVQMGTETLRKQLNLKLPGHMKITQSQRINPSFKVNHLVTKKEYWYFLTKEFNPLFPYAVVVPEELDWNLFQKACSSFLGVHDFTNYQCKSTVKGDFKREIFSCLLEDVGPLFNGGENSELKVVRICGRGFLKQQIRLMIGALCRVAEGLNTEEELEQSLKAQGPEIGLIAPACGLFLKSIEYPKKGDGDYYDVEDNEGWRSLWPDLELWRPEGEGAVYLKKPN